MIEIYGEMSIYVTTNVILISCGARLAPFDIRELLEADEMELDTLGDRKTALFVIISDTDDTFNFVVSILYTQLFNLLCDKADDEYGGRLPVHVRCLLDEFANIGQIPKFERLIATIRSREISASIILQSQSQLKAIYKDNRPFQPHAFTLLSSEGLGHFPTSYFQPTPRRAGGRKYGKGTLFLCLLRKFFLHYLQHREKEK